MTLYEIAKTRIPVGWNAENAARGVILHAPEVGYVTICETMRNYELGIASVRTRGPWSGRDWKKSLVYDAIKALQHAAEQQAIAMSKFAAKEAK